MRNLINRRFFNLTALTFVSALIGAPAMAKDLKSNDPVTLINAFEIPADRVEVTIAFWEKARDFLQQQPGYITTSLHQALDPGAKFQLVNVAKWESPEAYQAAIKKMRESGLGADMRGTVFHAALYQVVRSDGETD